MTLAIAFCLLTLDASAQSKLVATSEIPVGTFRETPMTSSEPAVLTSVTSLRRPRPVVHKNHLAIELLGRGGLYSLSYDRLIGRQVAMGLGISYLNLGARAGDLGNAKASLLTVPVYANLYMNSSLRHRAFASGGITLAHLQVEAGTDVPGKALEAAKLPFDLDTTMKASVFLPIPAAGLGYEYRSQGGILARLAAYAMYPGFFLPWGGLAVGAHY